MIFELVSPKIKRKNFSFREDGLEPITLASHATSDMMLTLEKMTSMWDGPISVGIFIDFHSSQALEYLAEVHRCDEEFRKKVNLSFLTRFQGLTSAFNLLATFRRCRHFSGPAPHYTEGTVQGRRVRRRFRACLEILLLAELYN